MLRGLVHLRDGLADLRDALTLFAAGGADLSHDVSHAADGADHLGHGGAGLVHQGRAALHAFHTGANQALDLFGGLGAALRQAAYFARHHRKAPALLACARSLHGGVQRQDVGLEGDPVDHADDVGDLAAAVVDALHGVYHLGHHVAALLGDGGCAHGQLVGGAGVVGVLAHGGAQLFHGGGCLFQCAGLLFGAGTQVIVARCNLGTGRGHALSAVAHVAHDGCEA